MGKRELLIAAVFLVLGWGVFRLTAPPADPSRRGFSLGRIVDEIRRDVRGDRGRAETTFTATREVPETVSEIRLDIPIGAVTIVGEDREDLAAEMHVRSTGFDDAEAARLAKESHLAFDEAGALLIISGKFPVEGRQTPTVRLRVPSRVGVRMDDKQSALEVSNVASVFIGVGRGRSVIERVGGAVSVTQRGSEIVIAEAGSVHLTTAAGAEARVTKVRGDAAFTLQGGELRAEELGGALNVESRNAEMQFEKLAGLRGPVRVNAMHGEVVFMGLGAEAQIDGRRTEIRIEHAGGARLTVYNEGDESIELTVPPVGFAMDARATDGQITLDGSLEKLGLTRSVAGGADQERNAETRVTGTVRGGGPMITLRANGGTIVVKGR